MRRVQRGWETTEKRVRLNYLWSPETEEQRRVVRGWVRGRCAEMEAGASMEKKEVEMTITMEEDIRPAAAAPAPAPTVVRVAVAPTQKAVQWTKITSAPAPAPAPERPPVMAFGEPVPISA